MKSLLCNYYKIIIFILFVLTVTGLIAVNYIYKSDYTEDVVFVSDMVPDEDDADVEEIAIPEEKNINLVIKQTESVDMTDIDTYTEPIQKLETENTALSPSELVAEITRVYNLAVEQDNDGQRNTDTREYLFKLIEDLKQLPEADLASLIYYSELSAEIFDLANMRLNPKSFLPFQNFVNSPLTEVGEPSRSSTLHTVEIGLDFRSTDEDSFDTYMYSQEGNFSGVITVSPDEDYFKYLLEEIRGVDVSTFAERTSFLVTDIREPVTFFFKGNSIGANTIELSGVNDSESITSLFFPYSSSTRASVTLYLENDITTVGKWNFDFDGDNVTDFSIGNGKEFAYEEYEAIFDIMERDTKLSDSDQTSMRGFRETFLGFVKKNQ